MCRAAQTLVLVKLDVFLCRQINFVSLLMKLLIFSSQLPFWRCNYSEPYLPASLPETSNSFAKSALPLASTSGGFGLPLLSHSEFSRGFSWKVALVQPQGHLGWKCVLCTTWKPLIFEESSPIQLPLKLLFSDEQRWSSDFCAPQWAVQDHILLPVLLRLETWSWMHHLHMSRNHNR